MSPAGPGLAGTLDTTGALTGQPGALLEALVDGVRRALPEGVAEQALTVERERSLGDRLAGRPGRLAQVQLSGPDLVLTLTSEGGGRRVAAQAARIVRGVAISRRPLALGEWLTALEGEVAALAAGAAGNAAAAARALVALGVRAPTPLTVDPADVVGGLRALPAAVAAHLPPEAAGRVGRIVEALLETLPRVAGSGEAELLVRRTATVYLPDTLRAYLALPAEWAATHVLANGSTPAAALTEQLAALENAVRGMHDAALEQDATALLVNGAFLADRFAVSSLDLP